MANEHEYKIRDLRNGGWYWINRHIINQYGKILRSSGLAVYNVLASYANSKSQTCFPSQKFIAEHLGLSIRTVNRKIRLLKEFKLIKVKKKRGRCLYSLLRVDMPKGKRLYDKRDTKDRTPGKSNNNKITRINNNNVNEDKKFNFQFFKGFKPKTRKELLALDIARELNDLKSLRLYLSYAKKYPESLLRKVLGEVKEIPMRRIKKGRAALFNYLIKKYAKETSKNHRH
jgi:DNA-binding MarR family transcriptional regulator